MLPKRKWRTPPIRRCRARFARLRLLHRSKPWRECILSRSWTMKLPFFSVYGEKLRIGRRGPPTHVDILDWCHFSGTRQAAILRREQENALRGFQPQRVRISFPITPIPLGNNSIDQTRPSNTAGPGRRKGAPPVADEATWKPNEATSAASVCADARLCRIVKASW